MRRLFFGFLVDDQGRPDEQALISLVGAAVFFALEVYSVTVRGQSFDALGFGTGFGTLVGATSAGFGLRARLTPGTAADAADPIPSHYIGGPNGSHAS